jgi:glycosyltransferase involved in cell wall biosynthesis
VNNSYEVKYPKISIITPSYNQGQFLEDTILSVLNQSYPNLEYIIIDGGSTDNSIDIIKKYEECLAYWVSETDQGQTHAINKGLKLSTGEILNWINSDDLLTLGSLHIVGKAFTIAPEADFCFGDFSLIDEKGRLIISRKSPPYRFRTLFYGRQLSCQPAVFFRRSVLEKIGYLDETFAFCMDLEFWIRAASKGMRFRQTKQLLAKARMHRGAKTAQLQEVLHEEHKAIVRRYLPWGFLQGSPLEDRLYTLLNKLWRFIAALNRCFQRRDWTFLKAGNALRLVKRTDGTPFRAKE